MRAKKGNKQIGLIFLLFLAKAVFALPPTTTLQVKVIDQTNSLISNFTAQLSADGKLVGKITSHDPAEDVIFRQIVAGKYVLEIQAEGFKTRKLEIEVRSGKNEITVTLEIAEIVEKVEIVQDAQEIAAENAFSNFLTDRQIAALPDDPREMEAELKRLAGGNENVIIRVDGFSGGRLPPKSRIASVRIVRSSYDAENHELGVIFVDVVTRVGNSSWSGSLSFIFNDEALNARNAFSARRFPEQNRNTFVFLSGPIVPEKTDFSLFLYADRDTRAQNIIAVLPDGAFNDSVNSRTAATFADLSLNHNLTKKLPVKFRYNFSDGNSENQGIGGFNLPDRAFSIKNRSHELRFSTAGTFAGRFLNEFRFQYKNEFFQTLPQNDTPAIIVLDSFNRGGAGNFRENSKQSFHLANNLLFGIENHALKFGGAVFVEHQAQTSGLNRNGTFLFSTLEDFQTGRPAIFSQSSGARRTEIRQTQIGAFIQDDVKIAKNLILSFGVRYEWQNNVRDFNNFSPRLAFSWTPFPSGKTTFRGGVGIFYNWLETGTFLTISSQDKNQTGETVIINPSFPNPYDGGTSQILPPSFLQTADDIRIPEVFHSSIGVQHRLSKASQFRLEYTYQKGLHQLRSRDVNAPVFGIRPDSNFGRIAQVESSSFFVRNALNIGYNTSLTRKISLTLDYTLARTLSDSSGVFGLPSDNFNLRADRASGSNDQRHHFNGFLSWQIGKGLRIGFSYAARSPLPYTITTGRDDNGDTIFNDRPDGSARNGARGAWRNQTDLNFSYIFSFINRGAGNSDKNFSVVTTSAESNSGFDLTDSEKRFSLKFFANIENLFNQTNLTDFVGVRTSPFFRQAVSAERARKITLGLRFNF